MSYRTGVLLALLALPACGRPSPAQSAATRKNSAAATAARPDTGKSRFVRPPRQGRPAGQPNDGLAFRADHRVRDVGLPVPLLPPPRDGDLPDARAGIHRHRQGALGVPQSPDNQPASECRRRRAVCRVRGQRRQVLAGARSALQVSGDVGAAQGPGAVPDHPRRLRRHSPGHDAPVPSGSGRPAGGGIRCRGRHAGRGHEDAQLSMSKEG